MEEQIFLSRNRMLTRCRICGEPLYDGDTAYRIGALLICPSCMDDALIVCRPPEEEPPVPDPVSAAFWGSEEGICPFLCGARHTTHDTRRKG